MKVLVLIMKDLLHHQKFLVLFLVFMLMKNVAKTSVWGFLKEKPIVFPDHFPPLYIWNHRTIRNLAIVMYFTIVEKIPHEKHMQWKECEEMLLLNW